MGIDPRAHRCRAKQRPPGRGANGRTVTLPALWGWFVGRSLVFRPALGGSFLATSLRPPAAPFAVLEPPVGRPSAALAAALAAASRQTRPQTLPLHCARASLHCVAGRALPQRRECAGWLSKVWKCQSNRHSRQEASRRRRMFLGGGQSSRINISRKI